MRKVKAHTTHEDAAEGLISLVEQAGNAAADFFAVQARTMAQRNSPVHGFEVHYNRARRWYSLAFRAIGSWKEDTLADVEQSGAEHQRAGSTRPDPQTQKHEVRLLPEGPLCRICGRRFADGSAPASLARQRCNGPMRARLLDHMGAVPNYARFAHTVAELMGAGAHPWRRVDASSGRLEVSAASERHEASGGPEPAAEAQPTPSNAARRRRLVGKQPDPLQRRDVLREAATGHLLAARGRLTYCERCGRWAIDRISKALTKPCAGTVETVKGSYRARRERMRNGRHPLTNAPV